MDRRKALVIASAATLVLGSGIVALASVSGASLLGFGGRAAAHGPGSFTTSTGSGQQVVVKTHNLYDRYMVNTGPGNTEAAHAAATSHAPSGAFPGSAAPTVSGPVPDPVGTPTTNADDPPDTSRTSPTTARPVDDPGPTTTLPSAPTTTIPTTTTTWPRGVPVDWPPGVPIPAKPVPCQHAQLTLDGVWHCDNSDD